MTYDELKDSLCSYSSKKQADFQRKLTFSKFELIGVKIPQLHIIAKKFKSKEEIAKLFKYPSYCLEMKLLKGIAVGNAKMSLDDKIAFIEIYFKDCDDWISTDVVSLKFKESEREKYFKTLQLWTKSKNIWAIRFAFKEMLSSFSSCGEYCDLIINLIKKDKTDEYYVGMAKAWLISELFIKQRQNALELLESKCLDKFTQNKAICKIRDSKQVSLEDKERVKLLRV